MTFSLLEHLLHHGLGFGTLTLTPCLPPPATLNPHIHTDSRRSRSQARLDRHQHLAGPLGRHPCEYRLLSPYKFFSGVTRPRGGQDEGPSLGMGTNGSEVVMVTGSGVMVSVFSCSALRKHGQGTKPAPAQGEYVRLSLRLTPMWFLDWCVALAGRSGSRAPSSSCATPASSSRG